MIDRRGLLTLFGKTMLAGAEWFSCDLARVPFHTLADQITPIADAPPTPEEQLQTNIIQLGSRVYSEEGIPMFLACEDLKAGQSVGPYTKALNTAVAPAFHRYVEIWQQLHPDAPAADVATLVELLAFKDFASNQDGTNL